MVGEKSPTGLEIKCHSCKAINIIDKPKKCPKKREKKAVQYKQPHCIHCAEYKDFTGTCIAKLRANGLGTKYSCKPTGSRSCGSFIPREEYKVHYENIIKGARQWTSHRVTI